MVSLCDGHLLRGRICSISLVKGRMPPLALHPGLVVCLERVGHSVPRCFYRYDGAKHLLFYVVSHACYTWILRIPSMEGRKGDCACFACDIGCRFFLQQHFANRSKYQEITKSYQRRDQRYAA